MKFYNIGKKKGQTTVELALFIPFIFFFILSLFLFYNIIKDSIDAHQVARYLARRGVFAAGGGDFQKIDIVQERQVPVFKVLQKIFGPYIEFKRECIMYGGTRTGLRRNIYSPWMIGEICCNDGCCSETCMYDDWRWKGFP